MGPRGACARRTGGSSSSDGIVRCRARLPRAGDRTTPDHRPLQGTAFLHVPSRIRIAFGLDALDIGGTELNAVRTAERLDRSRFDLLAIVLRGNGPLLERYRNAGIPVVEFPLRQLVSVESLRQGRRLAAWLRRERIDIVHTHDVYTNIFMAPWARMAGVPAVIASRRWWFTVPRPALNAANRIAYRFAHRVLANSPSVAHLLVTREHVRASRVLTIPNFVDDDAFAPLDERVAAGFRAAWGLAPDVTSVGIVARLDRVKRHVDLLRAWARVLQRPLTVRRRLVIVGDGPERGPLEALTATLGIGHAVCFAGMVAPKPALASLFDIVALSSEAEGFPNSIVEAMAAGRAVVATNVGGIVDCVVDGVTGVLVPALEPDSLADAITRLIANPAERARMGSAARERAMSQYHARVVLALLQDTYTSLASRRRAPGVA